jgi:hypothetical protein
LPNGGFKLGNIMVAKKFDGLLFRCDQPVDLLLHIAR